MPESSETRKEVRGAASYGKQAGKMYNKAHGKRQPWSRTDRIYVIYTCGTLILTTLSYLTPLVEKRWNANDSSKSANQRHFGLSGPAITIQPETNPPKLGQPQPADISKSKPPSGKARSILSPLADLSEAELEFRTAEGRLNEIHTLCKVWNDKYVQCGLHRDAGVEASIRQLDDSENKARFALIAGHSNKAHQELTEITQQLDSLQRTCAKSPVCAVGDVR